MAEIASAYKVTYHRKKLEEYLNGEQILPATLELDISTKCNKNCPLCPSTTSLHSSTLSLSFIERLFARLEGQTRGLLLSGGEPTMSPIFPDVLSLARKYGFIDITIVTNGSLLSEERIATALCEYASTIRVSVYDWMKESRADLENTLQKIKTLRSRINNEDSKLQIGVSALTSKKNADTVHSITEKAKLAGANWIYFHPMCIRWDTGAPERVDQSGVLTKIKECQLRQSDGFHVFTFPDRYIEREIWFVGYHAAHFLLVIGSDGKNYLGAEVKYNPKYEIADLTNNWSDDFFWQEERLKRIKSVNSRAYPAVASRHRGVLYNQIIQDLIDREQQSLNNTFTSNGGQYLFPHIL